MHASLVGTAWPFHDQRKPGQGGLTYNHAGHSVCRVPNSLPDDDQWLLQERQRIGRSIRDARMHLNLTQEQVFLAVPVSRSFYQEIEAGQGNPTIATLLRIARLLDVPLADLVR